MVHVSELYYSPISTNVQEEGTYLLMWTIQSKRDRNYSCFGHKINEFVINKYQKKHVQSHASGQFLITNYYKKELIANYCQMYKDS